MKTEQEWIKEYPVSLNNVSPGLITEIQKEAYNQAIEDAAETCEEYQTTDEQGEPSDIISVTEKYQILSLKK